MILERKASWFHRVNYEIYYLIILNITASIIDYQMYISNLVIFQLIFLILILLILSLKRSRVVYKIEFDDIGQRMNLFYYQFILFNYSTIVPYSKLSYKYHKKNYGIVNRLYALMFYSSQKWIVEISENNRAGWSKDEISEIINKLNHLDSDRNRIE